MEDTRKVIFVGVAFLVVVAVAVGIYYFFVYDRSEEPIPVEEVTEEIPAQVPEEIEEEEIEPLQVELDESDSLIRELAKNLSSHKKFAEWLQTKDLTRKFTAAVDNIADGLSPRYQIDFFSSEGDFEVERREGIFYLDPESYSRYDRVADVFLSLNTKQCVRFYKRSMPLIQKAYRDLGYPDEDFNKTLTRAIIVLLKVPIVERDIALRKKVVTYMYSNPELEHLNDAQKHLLRMGPENMQIIQEKLRAIALELGIPEYQLPK